MLAVGLVYGTAAWRYGPEYVWRQVVWPWAGPAHATFFPVRQIAPAAVPFRFAGADAAGEAAVRAAFARVAPPHGIAGRDMDRALAANGTTGLVVVQDDRLLYEGYFNGRSRESPQPSFSVAKSIVGLLVGAAIADGRTASVDVPVETLLPDIPGLRGSGITLRHLLLMSSGLRSRGGGHLRFVMGPWSDDALSSYATDLRQVLAEVRPGRPPGERFGYEGRGTQLLGLVLERVTGEHVADYFGRRLWRPIGAEFPASWSLDSEDSGLELLESGLNARTIDFAKIGRLVLRRGDWDGVRLLPADWIDRATAPPDDVPPDYYGLGEEGAMGVAGAHYGFHWYGYERPDGSCVAFAGGRGGQIILVHPAKRVVIVRNGEDAGPVEDWSDLLRDLAEALP
jgi:CubicO group peptidase (beta-lactamase class C family)